MKKSHPNPADKYAGGRVRARRLALGMSQEKLGDSLGITFQQVQKYEKGTNRISTSRLQQIANILEVPITFFFDDRVRHSKTSAADADHVSQFLGMREAHALARSFIAIQSPKLRGKVVRFAAMLAEEITGD